MRSEAGLYSNGHYFSVYPVSERKSVNGSKFLVLILLVGASFVLLGVYIPYESLRFLPTHYTRFLWDRRRNESDAWRELGVVLGNTQLLPLPSSALNCFLEHHPCNSFTNSILSFAVFQSEFHQLKNFTQSLCLQRWKFEDTLWWEGEVGELGLLKAVQFTLNLTLTVQLIEDRPNYWLFPALDQQTPAFATPKQELISKSLRNTRIGCLIPEDPDIFLWHLSFGRFLPCNQSVADQFARTNPEYQGNSTIPVSSVGDMAHLVRLLRSLHINLFLFGGTLLGWYRECGLIQYTTDLDVAFHISEYTDRIQATIQGDKRFKLYWMLGKPEDSLELSVFAGGVKIDLFAVYTDSDHSWVGGMNVPKRQKLKWVYPVLDEVCSADLYGELFSVPCNVVDFLESDYGPNWDKPHHSKNFHWQSSHHNVRQAGTWKLSEWRSVYRLF